MQVCNLVLFITINSLYASSGSNNRFTDSADWLNLGMWTCWNTVSD